MGGIFKKIQKTVNDLASQPLEVSLHSLPAVKNIYMRLVDTLQDKDKQLQSLTRAYLGAFSIIAVLSILGHIVTAHVTSNQRENAEVTFTITNLRSLVDTIISQSSTFMVSGDTFDDKLLSESIDRLKKEDTRIEAYSNNGLNGVFHDPAFMLNEKVIKFITMTEDFARYKRTGQNVEATAALSALGGETSKVLKISLDLALDQYRSDVMKQIERSYEFQLIAVLIILLVLVLEAAFIFRPLVRHLGEYHKHLLKLALTDMLTGLNNRRAFIQLANAGLDYYNRHKTPFALVLMDLDHFKSVNDTYWPQGGRSGPAALCVPHAKRPQGP